MRLSQTGFTLIELLVVIAIIGVLASVILAGLNDARQQTVETRIQGEMDSIAKRAAIEQARSFTYDVVCGSNGVSTSTVIVGLIVSINSLAQTSLVCNSDTTSFAVSVPLGSAHWCVDSAGAKHEIPNALNPGELVCP